MSSIFSPAGKNGRQKSRPVKSCDLEIRDEISGNQEDRSRLHLPRSRPWEWGGEENWGGGGRGSLGTELMGVSQSLAGLRTQAKDTNGEEN